MVEKGIQVHKTKTTESQLSEHSEHILPLGLREHTRGTGNTTHSGCRVLRSGGPNHSKPAVFIVFLSEIELIAS